jgi:two-component system KDP operon response regulator KdpE
VGPRPDGSGAAVSPAKILAIDDDPQILRALRAGLRGRGYDVLTAPNGETALELLEIGGIDGVILDLGLPGIDGMEVLERLRSWSEAPVIVLTVREDQAQKVRALDAGADDYVTKPFAMDELLARVRAVMRRAVGRETAPVRRFEDLELDLSRQLVLLRGERLHLTPTEYRLLEALATQPGRLMTHRLLLQRVWGSGYGEESEGTLRVFIRQLRRKLGDRAGAPTWIATEAGLGYRWVGEPTGDEAAPPDGPSR